MKQWGPGDTGSLRSSQLVDAIVGFIAGGDRRVARDIGRALEHEVDAAGPAALSALGAALRANVGWDYYPPDPLARRIHHHLAPRFVEPASALLDGQHLTALEGQPVIFVCNHLSYADANVIEVLLHRTGLTTWAQRLTALAGPKVYTSRQRRFSSLCFGTVKVPQSTEVASEEAAMSARDVAKAARRAIQVAQSRLSAGDALIVFGEGTRSRTGAMQPMLPAVTRYFEAAGNWIVPIGLVGPESLFPVEGDRVRPSRITVTFGAPFTAAALMRASSGDRKLAANVLGAAIAELLPASYRGVYGGKDAPAVQTALQEARRT